MKKSMKKEEKLLDALTDVKSSYIFECSQYVGNEQKEVLLLKTKKRHWGHFAVIAACMALFLTLTLVFLPAVYQQRAAREQVAEEPETEVPDQTDWCSLNVITSDRNLRFKTYARRSEASNLAPIQEIEVYDLGRNVLLQTIYPDILPSNYGTELFCVVTEQRINGTDVPGVEDDRDVNFDGYTDLGLAIVDSAADNMPYCYLLWNNDKQEYEFGFVLYGGTSSLEVDEENQTLIETIVNADSISQQVYRYEDGVLKIVESSTVDSVPEATEDTVSADTQPDYQITYDETQFGMTTGESGDCISPLKGVGSYQPTCEILIEYLPGVLPCTAIGEATLGALDGLDVEKTTNWNRTVLHVEYGDEWDSTVEDIYYVAAGVRGTYRLTARYYLEAEDYAELFTEICESFVCPLNDSADAEAERTVAAFVDAYFSSNLSVMSQYSSVELNKSNLLNMNYTALQLVSLDGLSTVDEQISGSGSAELDLTFRYNSADTGSHLRMEITKVDGEYKLSVLSLSFGTW